MIKQLLTLTLAGVMSASTSQLVAAHVKSFQCSGSGVFSPANIGTAEGGTFGLVLGDGS